MTLLKLYLAHIRPLLEYVSLLWDPHQKAQIDSLERVQKFGLLMVCKQWDCNYENLLTWADLPLLKVRHIMAKLRFLAKMLHGAVHIFIPLPAPRNMDSRLRSFQDSIHFPCLLRVLYNSYKFSFYSSSRFLYGISYLLGCGPAMTYLHLKETCASFFLSSFLLF